MIVFFNLFVWGRFVVSAVGVCFVLGIDYGAFRCVQGCCFFRRFLLLLV